MGIFVTDDHVYVADARNNRVQRFQRGEGDETTVAGNGVPPGLNLSFPSDVYVNDGEIFIADDHHHRIIRVLGNISRVIVGTAGNNGSMADQLSNAIGFQFVGGDRTLYVADENNHRIQKFAFEAENCRKSLGIFSNSLGTE